MSIEVAERRFEEAIECALLENGPDACEGEAVTFRETLASYGAGGAAPGGYRKRRREDYDRGLCLLPDLHAAGHPCRSLRLDLPACRAVSICRRVVGRWPPDPPAGR